MFKKLWPVLCVGVLAAGCDLATAPTRVPVLTPNQKQVLVFDPYGFIFDETILSHCVVKNVSDHPMIKGCIIQDMKDPNNPTDAGHGYSSLLQPGSIETISYKVILNPCHTGQFDGLDNVSPKTTVIEHPTESDINNNHVSALGKVIPQGVCENIPPPPPPPPPPPHKDPVCSADSFSVYYHTRSASWVETEHITVKPGFDGVVAYMMSWGVPGLFANFTPPLPQTRLQLVRQVLHVGDNTMLVQLAVPGQYPAWQMEFGCEPGPAVLVTGYEFLFLDEDFGDFPTQVN